jgi:hypothetical protein
MPVRNGAQADHGVKQLIHHVVTMFDATSARATSSQSSPARCPPSPPFIGFVGSAMQRLKSPR